MKNIFSLLGLSSSVLFSKKVKPNVLIFGASKGGEGVYDCIKAEYNVIGFVDNNLQVQGGKVSNKMIYAPSEIAQLNFHKIIVASDYYTEIYAQLTTELAIAEEKISLFNDLDMEGSAKRVKFSDIINKLIMYVLCNSPTVIAMLLFNIFRRLSNPLNSMSLKSIIWLDQLDSHKIKTFCLSKQSISFAPHFIGEQQKSSPMVTPDINLYHFKNAGIMTTANAIVYNSSNIAIGRVPSFPIKNSQYSAAFIFEHGSINAVVKKYQAHSLKCGIAIIGSNDTNYYHWVLEVLSKLQYIAELPKKYEHFPILLSEQAIKIPAIKVYVEYLQINRPIIYLNSFFYYEVEDLLYINSPNYVVANLKRGKNSMVSNYFSNNSLCYLRDSLLIQLDSLKNSRLQTRIFLARKGFIRDYNQNEVSTLLTAYDFEIVYLEDFTLLEQVQIMRGAEVIIGPTGAAWTNLIFCRENTKALCWMAEEYDEFSCFSNLAVFSEVELEYLRYKTGCKSTQELYYADYTVDVIKIEQWLVDKAINKTDHKHIDKLRKIHEAC